MDRGAWPFFVCGVICLVASVSVSTEKKKKKRRDEEEGTETHKQKKVQSQM